MGFREFARPFNAIQEAYVDIIGVSRHFKSIHGVLEGLRELQGWFSSNVQAVLLDFRGFPGAFSRASRGFKGI